MTVLTHDRALEAPASRTRAGLAFALLSAVSFGLSGALARPLLESGWSAGTVTWFRIAIAGVVVVPFGLSALRGRWHLLRDNARILVTYGLVAVTVAQFCYFSAVRYMPVAPALLIEFTAPAAVVVWMWLRHGQRPGPVTFVGAAHRRRRARARARRGVGCVAQPARRAVGARSDGRGHHALRDRLRRHQRPAADGAGGGRLRRRRGGARAARHRRAAAAVVGGSAR